MIIFFFFSSRRRHTRFSRDWSSDVCSSDLASPPCRDRASRPRRGGEAAALWSARPSDRRARSEERRVGKECSCRWSPYHLKKNAKGDVRFGGQGRALAEASPRREGTDSV